MSEQRLQAAITPCSSIDFGNDLQQWLLAKAQAHDLRWLLAHADDGINWGVMQGGRLSISHDHYSEIAPPLRVETLRQVRLFGPAGELYLWQVDDGWRGRFLDGSADNAPDKLATQYLLWGTTQEETSGGFMLLTDGAEGLRHAPPSVPGFDPQTHYLALRVHHYLAYDEDGQAYVAASRLVEINLVERAKERNG